MRNRDLLKWLKYLYHLFDKDFLKALWANWDGPTEEKMGTVYGMTVYVADILSLNPQEELNDQVKILDIYFIYYFNLD
jgi:hypothetical protein